MNELRKKLKELNHRLSEKDNELKESEMSHIKLSNEFKEYRKSRKLLLDLSNYRKWNHSEMLCWVLSLNNRQFKKYESVLKKAFEKQELKGADFNEMDNTDLQSLGVYKFGDRKLLLKEIKKLISQKQQNNNNNIEYENEGDKNEHQTKFN